MSFNSSQSLIVKQKFESIDIMRGIAILMVLAVHTAQKIEGELIFNTLYSYGQMGVQLFFVASAFTLCYSMEVRRSNDTSLFNFYIRRFFRIAPGYYFGILIYYSINLLCNLTNVTSAWKNSDNPLDILINILFLNGLYPPANNSVVPGGWSIGTEMLFYLIFPLIFLIYKLVQKIKFINLLIPLVALILSILIQYAFFSITKNPLHFSNNGFIYFSILNQLPVFCVGMSLYFVFKDGLLKKIKTRFAILMLVTLSCLSGYLMFKGLALNTFIYAITPFVSALSFVFLFAILQNKKVKNKTLEKIGVLSYSGYLLHIIFAYFLTEYLSKKMTFLQADIVMVILYTIVVLLTFPTANIMYKHIELKGTQLGKKVIAIKDQRLSVTGVKSKGA